MRPRLTKKVVRGLGQLHAMSGLDPSMLTGSSDVAVAAQWVGAMQKHVATPKRTGPVPKQFLKRRRSK